MNRFNLQSPLELSPENSRQDKIEIHIGFWTIAATDQTIAEFMNFLGREERSSSPHPQRLFQATNANMFTIGSSGRLKILSNDDGIRTLISGQLKIYRRPSQRFELVLQISINPTRFCVYQPRRRIRNGIAPETFIALATNQYVNRHDDEYTLDRKDNVLLSPAALHNASHLNYGRNFRRYIQTIIDYIDSEISEFRSENITLSRLGFDAEYVLRSVENYWEFSDENPILTIKQMESSFRHLANSSLISEFSGIHLETNLSAIGLRADLRAGERIKIYAKTNKRIRVEIEHKYKANPSLAENRRMTTNSIEELWEKIIESATIASTQVDLFINRLRQITASSQLYSFKAINFITALYETIDNIAEAKNILSQFLASSGIPRASLTEQQRLMMDRLITRRLVEYRGRPFSRYYIHSYYAQSVAQVFPN